MDTFLDYWAGRVPGACSTWKIDVYVVNIFYKVNKIARLPDARRGKGQRDEALWAIGGGGAAPPAGGTTFARRANSSGAAGGGG